MIVISIIGFLFCLLRPFYPTNTSIVGKAFHWTVLPTLGVKVKIFDKNKFENFSYPAVFISNHQDNLDAFILGGFVPKKTVSIGKKIIKYFPFFGQLYWLSGNILIDRKRTKRALGTMKEVADKMRERGTSVWIMPEGTRSRGKGLQRFKKGAFHLAIQTGYPIIPVSLNNYSQNINFNRAVSTSVYVKIHDPIIVEKDENPERDKVEELMTKAYNEIRNGIEWLDKKVQEDNETLS